MRAIAAAGLVVGSSPGGSSGTAIVSVPPGVGGAGIAAQLSLSHHPTARPNISRPTSHLRHRMPSISFANGCLTGYAPDAPGRSPTHSCLPFQTIAKSERGVKGVGQHRPNGPRTRTGLKKVQKHVTRLQYLQEHVGIEALSLADGCRGRGRLTQDSSTAIPPVTIADYPLLS